MASAMIMLYQIPKVGSDGTIEKAHFGGSGYALSNLGLDTTVAIWAGIPAIFADVGAPEVEEMALEPGVAAAAHDSS
ncbi:MAG: hypothetical protein ACR2KG_08080 [Nocardioidaceae bacterium]